MKLAELAQEVNANHAVGRLDLDARGISNNSRECGAGSVFVAIRGLKLDGHQFIGDAVRRGAIAVISEIGFDVCPDRLGAWITVQDARVALALGADALYGRPSSRLKLVGITGTNGKTTTAHLIDSLIRAAEGMSAMIGTIHHRVADRIIDAENTTPEASTTQRLLAQALERGCRSAVMEVSSHSIELHRADRLQFSVAVFTNLTRDHLDYHGTMGRYFTAKRKLFDGSLGSLPGTAVINLDDEYGRQLLRSARTPSISYGLSEGAQVQTLTQKLDERGLEFSAFTPVGRIDITSKLVGRPHVYNILATIATGIALEFKPELIARAVAECPSVPGRFERVTAADSAGADFAVVVDYAHTDDALSKTLQTAREVTPRPGRVIVAFGCGGDRDRTKRAPMGEIAGRLSDLAIVTSDNPRSEDPEAIIAEIETGLKKAGRPYLKIPDRREAIFRAVGEARSGDTVVIAGKGHETYQIIGRDRFHFDDREVAREALTAV